MPPHRKAQGGGRDVRAGGVGKALLNSKNKAQPSDMRNIKGEEEDVLGDRPDKNTCLDATPVNDFLITSLMSGRSYEAIRREEIEEFEDEELSIPGPVPDKFECFPRRPIHKVESFEGFKSLSKEELLEFENNTFLEWRRSLAAVEQESQLVFTPFERNLNFWRQFWRTLEKSDLILLICDARNPLLFYVDFKKYLAEISTFFGLPQKEFLVVLNKSDLITQEAIVGWLDYFKAEATEAVCYSALNELEAFENAVGQETKEVACFPNVISRQGLIELLEKRGKSTVGFTGFPNVGKSSMLNSLLSSTNLRVSVARTPGKTKHLQTMILSDNVTLCDCPGLVFPKQVISKAHLTVYGIASLEHLRDYHSSTEVILDLVGFERLLSFYNLEKSHFLRPWMVLLRERGDISRRDIAEILLKALAEERKLYNGSGMPDEFQSAKRILRDMTDGRIKHFVLPNEEECTSTDFHALLDHLIESFPVLPVQSTRVCTDETDLPGLDKYVTPTFDDQKRVTKRKQRQIARGLLKGKSVTVPV